MSASRLTGIMCCRKGGPCILYSQHSNSKVQMVEKNVSEILKWHENATIRGFALTFPTYWDEWPNISNAINTFDFTCIFFTIQTLLFERCVC